MKASEVRGLTPEEAGLQLVELQEESFNLRFQHVSGQLGNPIRLRQVRREIACIRTVMREQELAPSGGDSQKS